MNRLTATQAARNFSEILGRVAGGEQFEIIRNGIPIAVIGPPRERLVAVSRLREVILAAPPVDEGFADDLRRIREETGTPEERWPS